MISRTLKKIHPLNILFSLTSLTVVAVSIERFSFTARTYLQPFNYLRLHEVFQMSVLILLTVVIPFLTLWVVTNKFKDLQKRNGLVYILIFIVGIYFYTTGNGVHEMASFSFNTYCNTKQIAGIMCHGLFYSDYYFGNILYFIGAFLMNIILILFEFGNSNKTFGKKDRVLLIINSLIYSLAIIAYAGFDIAPIGLIFSTVMTVVILYFFLQKRKNYLEFPVITSMAVAYTVGTVISILIRFVKG